MQGISEHTDFECFTFIHQNAPGLEVTLRDGKRHRIASVEHHTLIVGLVFLVVSASSLVG